MKLSRRSDIEPFDFVLVAPLETLVRFEMWLRLNLESLLVIFDIVQRDEKFAEWFNNNQSTVSQGLPQGLMV